MLITGTTRKEHRLWSHQSFSYAVSKYLMGPYHVLGTALVAEEASKDKTDKHLCLSRAYNLAGGSTQ